MVAERTFQGFSRDALQFLVDLAMNNERAWFQARKADYERLLKEPLEALCTDLADEFERRKVPLRADPKKSPFRIYRDTRFSKDKSPYKTNLAADFPWAGKAAEGPDELSRMGRRRRLLPPVSRGHLDGRRHVAPRDASVGRVQEEGR